MSPPASGFGSGCLIASLLLWGFFCYLGVEGLASIAGQHAPGYPAQGQILYYLGIPLGIAFLILATLLASWRRRLGYMGIIVAVGSVAFWPFYIIYYTGGM
ncbi:MAG: hypothetical protein WDN44_01575 [Sphingomonas sp.]